MSSSSQSAGSQGTAPSGSAPTPNTNTSTSTSSNANASAPSAPSTSTAAPNTGASPSSNGESSKQKTKQPKPSKAEPTSKAKAETAGTGKEKEKSAKELKKEKRAALVASRGAGDDEKGGPSGKPSGSAAGHGHGSNANGNANANTGTPSHSHISQGAGRRPPNISTEPALHPSSRAQQEMFFSHLPAHKNPNTLEAFETSRVHPTVVRLGVLMASGTLRGANARTIGMMSAFQEVIRDYQTPESAIMWKDLMSHLSPMITYLEGCRPKGQGGGNAIRWLKSEINRIGEEGGRSEAEQRDYLIKAIDSYLEVRISLADQVIADTAREKIRPGATVVTYARSSVVERVIVEAWTEIRKSDPEASFSVVVVDSRPLNEGRNLLDALTARGVPCTYVLLTQASHLISRSSLVLLGASALHSDGALYARAGTAMVAMIAKEHRIPVVACVETYKFGEKVQLDGLASNELGIGEDVYSLPSGKEIKEDLRAGITPLSLLYDLTPPECITAVCTEIGFIPPSSVPTVLGKGSGVQ